MPSKDLATFCNPFWAENFPDPFVLKVRGRYYAYATEYEKLPPLAPDEKVFPILTSTDLVQWRAVDKAMAALGEGYFSYWAPEVTVYNGQFLLYYAVHTEEFVSGIRVAVAERPEGPFVDSGRDLTSHLIPWAIDPHVFRDQDGQWYLYMTIEFWDNPDGFTGVGNVVDRLSDPFTLEGHLTRVTTPRHAWQLFQAKRPERRGLDWYTVEGPAVVQHRRHYYEMFSGGCYYRDNYAVSYAISDTPMGPGGMQDTSWHDWQGSEGNMLFIRGNGTTMLSPGHNSFVAGPNNADLYIVYHVLQEDMLNRYPCLDRLFWHGDEPWTPAPTDTPQPVPALPRLRELFEAATLAPSWHEHGGHWQIAGGEVVQQDNTSTQAALQQQEEVLSTTWLLEVNLRLIEGAGKYGVLLQSESGTVVQIAIEPSTRLTVSSTEQIQTMLWPRNFVASSWHQLIISLSGSLLRVQLDYLQALEVVVAHPPSLFALFTEGCSAGFSGISLTDHFRDEFLDEQQTPALLGWQVEGSETSNVNDTLLPSWRIHKGRLEQTSGDGQHILLKGSPLREYELGAMIKLQQVTATEYPALGLVAGWSGEEHLFAWFRQQKSGWILALEGNNVVTSIEQTVALPATFDLPCWHALRLVRQDEQMTIWLDGQQMLTVSVSSRPARIGLITRHAAAAFTGVWQTGLSSVFSQSC